jgi:hypothetical protein
MRGIVKNTNKRPRWWSTWRLALCFI